MTQTGATDWNRIDRMTDAEIAASVATDPDAAPILDTEWFRTAALVMPEPKQAVSLRIDTDVLRWYKDQGPGYQSRMNAILREYAKAHGAAVADRSVRVRRG
ncbi:MAG TPA: BrnA antitoxin family protein [Acetobacteraceae bacterium]|nr:BrnA antitoxin family protein [Acetobacteraceae bacterium]